jgi:hypothetical protein
MQSRMFDDSGFRTIERNVDSRGLGEVLSKLVSKRSNESLTQPAPHLPLTMLVFPTETY